MTLLISLLLLLLVTPPLNAQESYSEFERGLGLTDSQKTQVEEIRNKYIGEWKALKKESIKKRLELKELNKNPSANPERINQLRNEISDIEQSRGNLYNQYRGEVSRNLTQEQREKYNSFCDTEQRQKMRSLRQQRRYGK